MDCSDNPYDLAGAEGPLADARQLVRALVEAGRPLSKPLLCSRVEMHPDRMGEILEYAVRKRGSIIKTAEGYVPA